MSIIAIVDYDVGNIKSIFSALEKVGAEAVITRNKEDILTADGVILPGVGAFSHGMEKLYQYDLVETVKEFVQTNKPLLGICLGMQMLFNSSSEFGETLGLALIPGKVVKLTTLSTEYQKLPHVSWSEVHEKELGYWKNTILTGITPNEHMYFVHSFIAVPDSVEDILSTSIYSGQDFCSAVKHNNIYGCQFHPEKSAVEGLKIISNFINICKVRNND